MKQSMGFSVAIGPEKVGNPCHTPIPDRQWIEGEAHEEPPTGNGCFPQRCGEDRKGHGPADRSKKPLTNRGAEAQRVKNQNREEHQYSQQLSPAGAQRRRGRQEQESDSHGDTEAQRVKSKNRAHAEARRHKG